MVKLSRDHVEAIGKFLSEWDPRPRPAPGEAVGARREYGFWAMMIYQKLRGGHGVAEVGRYLGRLREEEFELAPDAGAERETAQRLCDWWNEKSA